MFELYSGYEKYTAVAWDRDDILQVVDESGRLHGKYLCDFPFKGYLSNRFFELPHCISDLRTPSKRDIAREIRSRRKYDSRYITVVNNYAPSYEYHTFLKSAVNRVLNDGSIEAEIYERTAFTTRTIFAPYMDSRDLALFPRKCSKCSPKTTRKIYKLLSGKFNNG